MDPTTHIAPTPFPYVVTSANDQPLYGVTEHLPDGTISSHLNYLYMGRNLVGSDPFICEVFVAAEKGAQDVHAIIDVGEDGMVLVRDPFGHGTTVNGIPLPLHLWARLLPGGELQIGTSRLRIWSAQSITGPTEMDLLGGGAGLFDIKL
ncbi:MAG: hypothetical protein J3Q66DRAFT_443495 [Benniella sp.]|nr:MAG: hypothetical protein J3Q66DRAFT_443495 [Benniella sp.]